MDMELKYSSMAIPIKVNIEKENSMAKESIVGLMDHHMRVILMKVFDMAMVVGNQLNIILTFMQERMLMIKKVDLEDMLGQMDAFIKAHFQKMLSKYLFYYRHGKGKLIYNDGKQIKGVWEDGSLIEATSEYKK